MRNGDNYGKEIGLSYSRGKCGSVCGSGSCVSMGNNSCRSRGSGRVRLREGERGKKLRVCCCEWGGYKR